MRMAFGLVGILVVLGVIIMIMHNYSLPVAKSAIQTKKKVDQQFGSNTSAGLQEQKDTIQLDDVEKGGKFAGLKVAGIDPSGPLGQHYGLQKDDVIKAVGGMTWDTLGADGETARSMLFEAKMRSQELTVLRNGQEIKLPK